MQVDIPPSMPAVFLAAEGLPVSLAVLRAHSQIKLHRKEELPIPTSALSWSDSDLTVYLTARICLPQIDDSVSVRVGALMMGLLHPHPHTLFLHLGRGGRSTVSVIVRTAGSSPPNMRPLIDDHLFPSLVVVMQVVHRRIGTDLE